MTKFSIIIPVYNTEKYIKKCLDSIKNQTYNNYEIIVINDGSTDDSEKEIQEYIKKNNELNIKYIYEENSGPSIARNTGVKYAKGEYILFVDSDDYISKDLLLNLSKYNSDVIRYQTSFVTKNKKNDYYEKNFENLSGIEAFKIIVNYHYIDVICLYAYNRQFYTKNKYFFTPNKYHEDFGLIPRIIVEANTVTSINYIGYNYIQRENSIMTNKNYEKEKKKIFDMLYHFKYLNESKVDDKIYKSFIANSVILKARKLNKIDYKIYVNELKRMNVFSNVLADTFVRKLKKMLMKINLRFYLKVVK